MENSDRKIFKRHDAHDHQSLNNAEFAAVRRDGSHIHSDQIKCEVCCFVCFIEQQQTNQNLTLISLCIENLMRLKQQNAAHHRKHTRQTRKKLPAMKRC